jgi:hypothetical protein
MNRKTKPNTSDIVASSFASVTLIMLLGLVAWAWIAQLLS